MIRRRVARVGNRMRQRAVWSAAAPAVNAVAFAVGALCGFLFCRWLLSGGHLAAERMLTGYAPAVDARAGAVSFWETLWDVGRWPLLVWVLGSTALGRWMVPLAFGVRGFLLSFAVAGLSVANDGGVLLAFCLFGLSALISLPVLFLLGSQSWEMAGKIHGRLFATLSDYPKRYWIRSLVGLMGVLVCALAEYWWLPAVLRRLSPLLG